MGCRERRRRPTPAVAIERHVDDGDEPALGDGEVRHNPWMEEPAELQDNEHWRMAVWALRVGYLGLAVAVAGLAVMRSGSSSWVLAAGVILWLAAAAVTLAGFIWARHELADRRPGLWSMRLMLMHDTVRPRPPA